MRVQDFVAEKTAWVVDNLYKNVERMPEDKLTWKVDGVGRSVIEQLQECAQSPSWTIGMIRELKTPEFSPDSRQRHIDEMKQWTTVAQCEAAHRERLAMLVDAIRATPDDALSVKLVLPFAPEPVAISDIIMFHYWNVTYHLGQIMFIQTLYGDHEMTF